jgi:hypothetical protein
MPRIAPKIGQKSNRVVVARETTEERNKKKKNEKAGQ